MGEPPKIEKHIIEGGLLVVVSVLSLGAVAIILAMATIYYIIQTQKGLFENVEFLALFVSIIGIGITGFKTIYDYYYKEPTLKFDNKVGQYQSERGGIDYYQIVSRKRGHGRAQGCEGSIAIQGLFHNKSVWRLGRNDTKLTREVGTHEELLLFRKDKDQIYFPSALSGKKQVGGLRYDEVSAFDYSQVREEVLLITLDGITGHMPPPKEFPIHEIVEYQSK